MAMVFASSRQQKKKKNVVAAACQPPKRFVKISQSLAILLDSRTQKERKEHFLVLLIISGMRSLKY
jgi:hypothetical protein